MPRTIRALVIAAIGCAWLTQAAAGQGTPSTKIPRWESNLSLGVVDRGTNSTVGVVKTFWYYALPRIAAVGLSLDYVGSILPISLVASLNLPTPVAVPFVAVGAGFSPSRGGTTCYGAGIKLRLWGKIGLIAEYRKYSHEPDPLYYPPETVRARPHFIGAGIAYLY